MEDLPPTKIAYDLETCLDFVLRLIWASSKSLEEKVQNSCLAHIFLIEKNWKFLLHTKPPSPSQIKKKIDPEVERH